MGTGETKEEKLMVELRTFFLLSLNLLSVKIAFEALSWTYVHVGMYLGLGTRTSSEEGRHF